MEIKNEEHAAKMLDKWSQLPVPTRKNQIKLAIEKLELNSMYYEQKGNDKGVTRSENCIILLRNYLSALEK